jgi:hypothetical protein
VSVLDWLQQYLGGGSQSDPGAAMPQSPDALQRLQTAVGADSITPSFDRPTVPDTGVGTYWQNATQAADDIGTAAAGLAERFNKGALNTLGFRQPGGDIYRGEIPVGPGLQRAGDVATFATGGLANSLYPTAGALRAGAQYAVPPGTMPGLLADEMGGIRAFHGSPHDFDRFDLSKIGTGEGAQAYGHGLYFAENEGVARGYRDALAPANTKWMYGDKELSGAEQNAAEILNRRGDADNALSWLKIVRQGRGADQKYLDATEEAIRRMDPSRVRVIQSPGSMYEVDINADPARFLDWDRPLSEQPPTAIAFAKDKWWGTPSPKLTGEDIYRAAGYINPADSSAFFNKAGIPGIRYLDQGSRGGGQGTSNYAVFDDSLIQILRKYGIAGLLGGGAATAAQDY